MDYTPEQLDALKRFKPALYRVLMSIEEIKPYGCSNCPYATEKSDVNFMDRDEGYYHCALLAESGIWGENPKCERADWLSQARSEAIRVAEESVYLQSACERLYVKISTAVYRGEDNETVGQVKSKILAEEPESVRKAFDKFLKDVNNG